MHAQHLLQAEVDTCETKMKSCARDTNMKQAYHKLLLGPAASLSALAYPSDPSRLSTSALLLNVT